MVIAVVLFCVSVCVRVSVHVCACRGRSRYLSLSAMSSVSISLSSRFSSIPRKTDWRGAGSWPSMSLMHLYINTHIHVYVHVYIGIHIHLHLHVYVAVYIYMYRYIDVSPLLKVSSAFRLAPYSRQASLATSALAAKNISHKDMRVPMLPFVS